LNFDISVKLLSNELTLRPAGTLAADVVVAGEVELLLHAAVSAPTESTVAMTAHRRMRPGLRTMSIICDLPFEQPVWLRSYPIRACTTAL
jgi:hypothetical protein